MKQSIQATVLAIALALPLVMPMSSASAFDLGNMHETLIQRLAQRFGLQQSQVQSVFNEIRAEKQTEMQKALETRLTQAVSEGKLTEAQKQLLLAKHKEIHAQREQNRETWQSMTPQQRRDAMQKAQTELQAWAKANNIDLDWLMGYGMGKMGTMGRMMWR